MLADELGAHADAGVADLEYEARAGSALGLFGDRDVVPAARAVVFDRIAQQIQKDAPQMQGTAHKAAVGDGRRIEGDGDMLVVGYLVGDDADGAELLVKIEGDMLGRHLALLQRAHVEDIVEQR